MEREVTEREREEFEKFVAGIPSPERAVPFLEVEGKDYSPQDILSHWYDPSYAKAKEQAARLIFALRAGSNLAVDLSNEFITRRVLKKFELGMIAPFFIAPSQRVTPEELVEHVKAGDRIGQMKIQAERLLLRELSKPLEQGAR